MPTFFFPLADLEGLFPMLIPVVFLMIPIIAILTRHQQNMARIIHERRGSADQDGRVLAELQALRQLVAEQTLTIDDLSRRQSELSRRIESDVTLRERLNS